MLYNPFTPATIQQQATPTTYDINDMDVKMPTPIPSKTKPIVIPPRAAPQPTLYADYTDYGEIFFDEPSDYDMLDAMIKLERVPSRRDSGYQTFSSPMEKLVQEEHHIKEAIPAVWAAEHDVSHHVNVSTHRSRPRRSSSLLHAPPTQAGDLSPGDALPASCEAAWPSRTIEWCPTCKAALKSQHLTELHTPLVSPTCICQVPDTPVKRHRRNASGEQDSVTKMGSLLRSIFLGLLEYRVAMPGI